MVGDHLLLKKLIGLGGGSGINGCIPRDWLATKALKQRKGMGFGRPHQLVCTNSPRENKPRHQKRRRSRAVMGKRVVSSDRQRKLTGLSYGS